MHSLHESEEPDLGATPIDPQGYSPGHRRQCVAQENYLAGSIGAVLGRYWRYPLLHAQGYREGARGIQVCPSHLENTL
jgi:hypothetical protein